MNRLNRSTETVWQQYVVEGQVKIFAKKFEIFSHRFMKFSNFFYFFLCLTKSLNLIWTWENGGLWGFDSQISYEKGFNHKHKGFMRWNGIFRDQNGIKIPFYPIFIPLIGARSGDGTVTSEISTDLSVITAVFYRVSSRFLRICKFIHIKM